MRTWARRLLVAGFDSLAMVWLGWPGQAVPAMFAVFLVAFWLASRLVPIHD